MLDLLKGARVDERFHLQRGRPVATVSQSWFHKTITWSNIFLPDGAPATFVSRWIFGRALHWYRGTAKCDGTRTRMYWAGQMDDGRATRYVADSDAYVMTTTHKEMASVRFFVKPGEPTWDNMGGS